MTTINTIRKALKEAGFYQYESNGVGKCGVAREFGDFQVKEEGRVVFIGKRQNRRRTEKTGRIIVVCQSYKRNIDEMAAALEKAGIATNKAQRTNEQKSWELNWDNNVALIIA